MSKVEWEGFVNIRLESHHKASIKTMADELSDADLVGWVLEMADGGYQVSVSPDDDNGCCVASLTGKQDYCKNAGLTMSQRHDDPRVALVALYFAHAVIADGEEWEVAQDDWRATDW